MITATYSLITRWFNQSATCFWPRSINLCSVKEKTRKWWVWKFSEKLYPNYSKTYSQLPLQNDVDDWGYMNKILQVIQYRCMFTSTINLAKAKRNVDRFYLYSWSQLLKFNHNTFFPVHLCSPNDRCILLRSKIHCNLWPLEEQCLT